MHLLCDRLFLESDDDTHNTCSRGEEQPTVLNVRSWSVADHVLDVIVKAVRTWKNTVKILVLMLPN